MRNEAICAWPHNAAPPDPNWSQAHMCGDPLPLQTLLQLKLMQPRDVALLAALDPEIWVVADRLEPVPNETKFYLAFGEGSSEKLSRACPAQKDNNLLLTFNRPRRKLRVDPVAWPGPLPHFDIRIGF